MQLSSGDRIGAYEITGTLGAGGMGEVYRARDAKLNRDVAIKMLPELFASDRERVMRFEREAQTLAGLNHQNIAHVHGVIDQPLALVMELVEGDDLSARIGAGGIPLEDALPIARQITEALEAAHERGVVHRDLKPANVKVREDGVVKVLDFGLAKAMDSLGSASSIANSPTFMTAATELGTILGTAAYMSPEQARGKAVDKRADIWAFGCVLFEMLSGRRPFEGETIADILGAIVHKEPDFSLLPAGTPAAVRALIARCLEKDATRRLRDIGEARVALTDLNASRSGSAAAAPAAPAPRLRRQGLIPWILAGAATIAAMVFAALWMKTPAAERPPSLFAYLEPPADKQFLTGALALSPDGRRIVFSAAGSEDSASALWVQDLASGVATPIKNTEDGERPFWSPDGRDIGFFAEGKLKRVDLQGGPAQIIADAPTPRGGSWGRDGRIVFAALFRSALQVVNAGGGAARAITSLTGDETSHRWPVFLPDGKHVMFLSQTGEGGSRDDSSSIDVVGIDGSPRRKLIAANSSPLYAEPGFLMFWRAGSLLAQRLDARDVVVSGDPFMVVGDVLYDQTEAALATASESGRLVYFAGGIAGQVTPTLLDRAGRVIKPLTATGSYECGMALSPDGKRLVAGRTQQGANGCDLWMFDTERGSQSRLTLDDRNEGLPLFAADGKSILYSADKGKNQIMRLTLDGRGVPEPVFEKGAGYEPDGAASISRDGKWMILTGLNKKGIDIIRYDFETKTVKPIVASPFEDTQPVLSPDEKWVAYASDRSGRMEVYVEAVSGEGDVWAVSAAGGTSPRWRDDGRELFFYTGPNRVMTAEVSAAPTFRTSTPKELFRAAFAPFSDFIPGAGGKTFVVNISEDRTATQPMIVLSDWRPR